MDFDNLLDMVKLDSKLVDNLTDEQVTELRKKLNPYGRTIEGSGDYTCLSITNLSEKYMQRFLMTSLVAFLYRQCDEYLLDDGEPPCRMDSYEEYIEKHRQVNEEAVVAKAALAEEKGQTETDTLRNNKIVSRAEGYNKRLVVRQFIDELFQFNPDKHVRSAYSDNPLDPERADSKEIIEHIPPADTFHRWAYYTESNYHSNESAMNQCNSPMTLENP